MRVVARTIAKTDPHATVDAFCRQATLAVRRRYSARELPRLAEHPEERLTASCIIYSRLSRQIWMIGDCQCLVDGQRYDNPKPDEAPLAEARAAIDRQLIEGGTTVEQLMHHDDGRDAILPELVATMQRQNRDYAVIDGFPIAMAHVRVLTLDFSPHEIVLASDGYPFLLPTLQESEDALARQLETDPLCIRTFVATKGLAAGQQSFDDRAYIRLQD